MFNSTFELMRRVKNIQKLKRNKIITFICLVVAIFFLSATPKQLGKAHSQSSEKVKLINQNLQLISDNT